VNALLDEKSQQTEPFELNAKLDAGSLNADFRRANRLHIENALAPASAVELYKHVAHEVEWRSFVVAKERALAAPTELRGVYPPELEKELSDCAYEGAASGFAYLYDANRIFAEDVPEGASLEEIVDTVLLAQLAEFVNAPPFMDFIRTVTGAAPINRAAIRATRFRSGHFEMFHGATFSADKTRKRVADFSINLTPEWKPEWGGLLHFRQRDANAVEAYVPTFNSLDIYAFPKGHWISCITPFAGGARFAISGRLYAEP
jgi:SM-20-related protein